MRRRPFNPLKSLGQGSSQIGLGNLSLALQLNGSFDRLTNLVGFQAQITSGHPTAVRFKVSGKGFTRIFVVRQIRFSRPPVEEEQTQIQYGERPLGS